YLYIFQKHINGFQTCIGVVSIARTQSRSYIFHGVILSRGYLCPLLIPTGPSWCLITSSYQIISPGDIPPSRCVPATWKKLSVHIVHISPCSLHIFKGFFIHS